jgi:hypothetical protein
VFACHAAASGQKSCGERIDGLRMETYFPRLVLVAFFFFS